MDSQLTLSRYNTAFRKNGEIQVFNTMTGALLALDPETWNRVKSGVNSLTRDEQTILRENGLAVASDWDELAFLAERERRAKANSKRLALTLLPAMACNFNCPYCYEANRKGLMTDAVADRVDRFVAGALESGIEDLDVTWFGGEPLLGKHVIRRLSEAFLRGCAAHGVRYEAFMVTNGSLLDKATRVMLLDCRVRDLQVTLDGPAHVHNRRRPSLSGQGTFERIVRHVAEAHTEGFRIDVRVNVDQDNLAYVSELLNHLGRLAPGILVSFARVDNMTDASATYARCLRDNRDFAPHQIRLIEAAFEAGVRPAIPVHRRNVACVALIENHFLVNPTGSLAKCWNEASDETKTVGYLSETGQVVITNDPRRRQWGEQSPLLHDKCRKCPILPLCMGNCFWRPDLTQGEPECPPLKASLAHMLTYVAAAAPEEHQDWVRG